MKVREGFVKNRCPKCGGNLYLTKFVYGWYEKCLQCGYDVYLADIAEINNQKPGNNREEEKTSLESEVMA